MGTVLPTFIEFKTSVIEGPSRFSRYGYQKNLMNMKKSLKKYNLQKDTNKCSL
jgi:hypothetical protein